MTTVWFTFILIQVIFYNTSVVIAESQNAVINTLKVLSSVFLFQVWSTASKNSMSIYEVLNFNLTFSLLAALSDLSYRFELVL